MKLKLSTLFFCFLALSAQAAQRVSLPLTADAGSVQATVADLAQKGYEDRVQGIRRTSTGYVLGNYNEQITVEINTGGGSFPGGVGIAVMSYGASFYTSYGYMDNTCEMNANADLSSAQAVLYQLAQRYRGDFNNIRSNGSGLVISDNQSSLELIENTSNGFLAVMNYALKITKFR